ncbi:MAG TPA: hypothetical protein PKL65_10840 [Bacteroidales bacterium]|nr:hypothetical protein [Bacteroidales bacterium]HNR42718.1 hypothetical protein [Bacteroidales bacterium]HPM17542.1 hypothetical protein [Bacteroidales bacterium]
MEDQINNTGQGSAGSSPGAGYTGSRTGQNLGIAALITAIVTFVFAVIPCVGLIAIIPGVIAIVLAVVGLSRASESESRGVLIAGLVIAVVASIISFSQLFVAGKIIEKAKRGFGGDIENIIRDVQKDVLQDLEDAKISIKVESNGDKVEIKADTGSRSRIEELEELERTDSLNSGTNVKK